jgi:hypothetical protein
MKHKHLIRQVKNLFTGRSLFFALLLATLLLNTRYSYSQNLYLPPLSDLEQSLTTFLEVERDAQIRRFDEVKSADWHDILPAVGVVYTPTGSPRPALSWSPLQILDRKENKKKRRLDRESIYLTYEILLTDRLYKLKQMYQDYMIDWEQLKTDSETMAIDEELFAIDEHKYKENIIKPSEYLAAKKSITIARSNLHKAQMELLKRKNEVLYEAKWDGMQGSELTNR